ncbi:MAG: 16S rRNA (guanine(966)-N(2))-methyltransferase RsmD [Collinsella sp.]|nr:16S rRNA (guanine(966)-N(2))-methyltransferase RsmD [Collinsella sp.]
MRIVAGEWRGRRLSEPRGRETTRPTTDRVREACASMVTSALPDGIEGIRVLDAFAGSGALGMEFLSRGAASATFFDIDRGAAALVRKNLEALSCPKGRYRIVSGDVSLSAAKGRVPGGPFDLVLLDPPYAMDPVEVARILDALAGHGLIAEGAIALYEHAASAPGTDPERFEVVREKRYGTTAVDLLVYRP